MLTTGLCLLSAGTEMAYPALLFLAPPFLVLHPDAKGRSAPREGSWAGFEPPGKGVEQLVLSQAAGKGS